MAGAREGPTFSIPSQAKIPFVGRVKEREALSKAVDEAKGKKGTTWLVAAPAGMGKTRIVREIEEEARGKGFRTLWGYCLKEVNTPFFPFQQVFRAIKGEGNVPAEGRAGPPADSLPQSSTLSMLHLAKRLEKEAARQPLLIVVDDLQWGDPGSLRTFQFLARNIKDLAVCIMATLRTDDVRSNEETREMNLWEILDAMEVEGTMSRLPLHGVSIDEALQMATGLLGRQLVIDPSGETFLHIYNRSGGSPFFLQEALRQAVTGGYVYEEGDHLRLAEVAGGKAGDSRGRPLIPDSMRKLVMLRLSYLSDDERELLKWAAVAGSEFELPPLSGVLSRPAEDVRAVVARLETHYRLLEKGSREGESWSFAHPLVWDVAMSDMHPADLGKRALSLADWWARNLPADIDTVARLYHDASFPERGLSWVRKAIDVSIALHATEVVERYHRWLQEMFRLANMGIVERAREGLSVVTRLEGETGKTRVSSRIYDRLLELNPPAELRWMIQAKNIAALAGLDPGESRSRLASMRDELEKVPGETVPPETKAEVALAEGRLAMFDGDDKLAVESAEKALFLFGESGYPFDRLEALYIAAWASINAGMATRGKEHLSKLREMAKKMKNPLALSRYHDLIMAQSWIRGDLLGAQRAAEETLNQRMLLTNPGPLSDSLLNLAEILLLRGHDDEAMETTEELMRVSKRLDDPIGLGYCGYIKGKVLLSRGKVSECRRNLTEAMALLAKQDYHAMDQTMKLLAAELSILEGYPDKALQDLDESITGGLQREEMHLRPILRAWAHEELKENDLSRKCLDEALGMAHEAGNALAEAQVKLSQARWEEQHGDSERGGALASEAKALFDKCGVLQNAWIRSWPPSASQGAERA
jgi:tetratricopeptide (TPR) repeat protein